jgi:hypothetical protein
MNPIRYRTTLMLSYIMKQLSGIFLSFCVVVFSMSAFADQYVHGYTRSNGTVVQPYYRSSPNNTVRDNFSYKGNVNPYTGEVGRNRYIHDKTSPYYQGPDSHGRVGHNVHRSSLKATVIPLGSARIGLKSTAIPIGLASVRLHISG